MLYLVGLVLTMLKNGWFIAIILSMALGYLFYYYKIYRLAILLTHVIQKFSAPFFSSVTKISESKADNATNIDNSVFFNVPVALLKITEGGKIIQFNTQVNKLLDLSAEQLYSLNFIYNHLRDHASFEKLQVNLLSRHDFSVESCWKTSSNGYKFFKENYKAVHENNDVCYLIYIEDYTENHKLKRSLAITEEKFKFLIDQVPIGIYRILATGELVFANDYLAKILGFNSADDIKGRQAKELFRYPEIYFSTLSRKLGEKSSNFTIEFEISTPGGHKIWIEDSARIFYDTSDEVLFYDGVIQDITERKNAEIELNRLVTAINQISEAIVVTDTSGNIIYSNPALEKMSGYSSDELLGKNMSIFKSGLQGKSFYHKLWNNILNGLKWEGTILNKRKNGEIYTEYMVITPVKNVNGSIINFIAVKRDLTEVIKLEEQLRHSQKLQAIGTLAGGIAHDFNNILMGMQIYTEVLMKRMAKDSYEFEILDKIYTSQNRAKDLIKQILSFSRQSNEQKAPLLVHSVVKEAMKLIQSTFPASITIQQHIEDCGYILGSPSHIHQIIMNLCTNANDAMEGNGNLYVELKRMNYLEFPEGGKESRGHDWIRIRVKDTGCGIDDKIKARIFDPFFTTKKVGQGTGLGLATVHGIVKEYGGEIFFKTQVGKGTDFYVYLPAM